MTQDTHELPQGGPEAEPVPAPKPVIDATNIAVTLQKLLIKIEETYAVTPANLRGALHTLLHTLDKNS